MTHFLLRDDDANATTDPEKLARAYAPLLDAGIPIALATIPDVALDTRAPDGSREAFIDPSRAPSGAVSAPLHADAPIIRFAAQHRDVIDVLQHGTTHARVRAGTEFGALNRDEAAARIARGKAILERALGRPADGFVAPWDRVSRGSLAAATAAFRLLSIGWVNLGVLPLPTWPSHLAERARRSETLLVDRCRVVRHRGGRIDAKTPASDVARALDALSAGADVAVVVLHHWMLWDAPSPHPAIVALAAELRRRGGVVRAPHVPALFAPPQAATVPSRRRVDAAQE